MISNYMRFDWAMRHLLRDNANFCILEGLLTILLQEEVKIQNLLESENEQEDKFDKYNRIDMLVQNSQGEFILIEVLFFFDAWQGYCILWKD